MRLIVSDPTNLSPGAITLSQFPATSCSVKEPTYLTQPEVVASIVAIGSAMRTIAENPPDVGFSLSAFVSYELSYWQLSVNTCADAWAGNNGARKTDCGGGLH